MKTVLFLLLVLCSFSTLSQVYKWTDEKGRIQYSSNPIHDTANVEKLEIKDKFAIPEISRLEPIKYKGEKAHRAISLTNIEFDITKFDSYTTIIGYQTCGNRNYPMNWDDTRFEYQKKKLLADQISETFQEASYDLTSNLKLNPLQEKLELIATLKALKLNWCNPTPRKQNSASKAETYVKIHWTLRDPIRDTVLSEATTKGSFNGLQQSPKRDGLIYSLNKSIETATINLLANQSFVENIKAEDLKSIQEDFDESLDAEVFYGTGSGNFKKKLDHLKNSTVTIKIKEGHGSGVIINKQGYVLTNAHVVGDNTDVQVNYMGQYYSARVVRKEPLRDVAIVKIRNHIPKLAYATLSEMTVNQGDNIYIIGTPLSEALGNTLTNGIVSAVRNISGFPFYQTDASINPGNSGGPVFDDKGELIALTVAGIFTKSGASLNINYLIPIDDVVNTLRLNTPESESTTGFIEETAKRIISATNIKIAEDTEEAEGILGWLNKPLFTINSN